MVRSGKTPNNSQSRSPVFGSFSAVAVAALFLFLYLQSRSLPGDPLLPSDPQGSWKQVHQALGISLTISPAIPRKPIPIKPSSGYHPPLRLADPDGDQESPKDKADLLRDFAALRSTSGRPEQRQ